ncbi:retrotransposon protein (fragment), putative [Candida dubliniensis CD36]|uniref:Retrotransposon protein, putative n=1 Tax=Candida dubliniensis (strain CD36 / ATCC MYA-646 / CBS 7987 / NCPF 3949 / NRRL Y-17841) TaxID=573826 RepID=B9WA61_CANDC
MVPLFLRYHQNWANYKVLTNMWSRNVVKKKTCGQKCAGSGRYQDIRTKFHFPDMYNTVLNYVASCTVCSCTKSNSHAPAGLLQASHPVAGRWTDIATDIVSGFPTVTRENATVNAIFTIVDMFTNRVHLYPISSSFSAEHFVTLFMTKYFPYHGLPQSITADRGPQFGSDFFSIGVQRS